MVYVHVLTSFSSFAKAYKSKCKTTRNGNKHNAFFV